MRNITITIISSRYFLWLLLAIPAWDYVLELLSPGWYYPEIMEASGILSMQILVFTLCITPLTLLLKYLDSGKAVGRWLLKNRRYFGVAGFAYAALHTLFYVRQTFDVELIWLEAFTWALGTGWISLLVMLPVAFSSNNYAIRKMGKAWKPLQRFSYIVIIAGFVHWLLLDFFIDNALMWIIPLIVAKLFQIGFRLWQGQRRLVQQLKPELNTGNADSR